MSRRKAPTLGTIDRFGTLRFICERLPKITAEAGFATATLLFLLWERAVAKQEGRTRGDVSVSALARAIGATRKTVAASLKYLREHAWIEDPPVPEGTKASRQKAYLVYHRRYGDPEESGNTPEGE